MTADLRHTNRSITQKNGLIIKKKSDEQPIVCRHNPKIDNLHVTTLFFIISTFTVVSEIAAENKNENWIRQISIQHTKEEISTTIRYPVVNSDYVQRTETTNAAKVSLCQ